MLPSGPIMHRGRLPKTLAPLALSALLWAGCDAPASAPAPKPAAPALPRPDPAHPLAVGIYDLALRDARGMVPFTPIRRMHLDRGVRQDYPLVLRGGRCYRVLAVGTAPITDLDLTLFDPAAVPMMQDSTVAPTAILGVDNPICPLDPGGYRLEVTAFRGAGDVGVQVFRSP